METASQSNYLLQIKEELGWQWPDNQTLNIICHGHSVPSGDLPHLLSIDIGEYKVGLCAALSVSKPTLTMNFFEYKKVSEIQV